MFDPKRYIDKAPCYWEVADDGAPFRCSDCGEVGNAADMLYALTPNGKTSMQHKACTDDWWLSKATKMPGKI